MADRSPDADLREPSSGRSPGIARFLAPLALIAVLIAVFAVVNGSLGEDSEPTADGNRTVTTTGGGESEGDEGEGDGAENPKVYEVESGDLLSTIAEKFDVSVDRLVRLNPDIDPQTLNPGTEIKIR